MDGERDRIQWKFSLKIVFRFHFDSIGKFGSAHLGTWPYLYDHVALLLCDEFTFEYI